MIEHHRTMPFPKIPPPRKKKGEKKERKEKDEDEMDEDEKENQEKPKDPTKTGALLSFPERAAIIARILHVSKSTCRRMLDFKSQYIRKFVEAPMGCVGRCRSNLIGNNKKQGDIILGRQMKAQAEAEAKKKAEAKPEAQPPVGKRSDEEVNEVEHNLMAGDDSLDIDKLWEETVDTVMGQDTSGQPGPPSASAAHGQSGYAHNGQYSQSYSMQGQNNAGQNGVMSNTGHNQGMNNNGQIPGMAYSGQQQGVPNTGHYNVINNSGQIQGTAYPGYQAVPNTGRNPVVNDNGQNHGTAYPGHQVVPNTGQNHSMPNNGQIPSMVYPGQHGVSNTAYSSNIPGVSNTGQFPPTNSTGLQSSMHNMGGMYMNPASNAPRQPYAPNIGYDQLGMSSEFSATAAPNSRPLNCNTTFDPHMWANTFGLELPPPQNPAQHYAQQAALLPTYHQPTSTPMPMAGQNSVVSNMGSNNVMPPNNKRSRKRSSTEAGADETGRSTKKRR
jgi:hypothetical protein